MTRVLIILMVLFVGSSGFAQETVFGLLKSSTKLADREFEHGGYAEAIPLYQQTLDGDNKNARTLSRLAQCYYHVRDFSGAIRTYEVITKSGHSLSKDDKYRYAEALSSTGNYSSAINWYKQTLNEDADNELLSKKVWALSNRGFLMEDSNHFTVKPLDFINTEASELGAIPTSNGLVFTSNRKGFKPLEFASEDAGSDYFALYSIEWTTDSVTNKRIKIEKPSRFAKSISSSFNNGPLAFYGYRTKMVYVSTSRKANDGGVRSLGLYFATRQGNNWVATGSFPFNSDRYSITDVTINEEGTRLFYSSDMRGGQGGRDIYMSTFVDNRWTKPVNIGEEINTPGDEMFPYLHRNGTLYFASNGLAGIGGLDIFRSTIRRDGFSEPENIGYPINSNSDDFGIVFDSLATHGYFTSNRQHGGADDDLFEFTMDLQTYPFEMKGVLKFKEHMWSEAKDIQPWANLKLSLVDTWQDQSVGETTSGEDGSFTFTVPYFSRYHIAIVDEKGNLHKASLELEKFRTESGRYEVVVVKDPFAERSKEPR